MKYKILIREVRPFLTIGELIADKHPTLYYALSYHAADGEAAKQEVASEVAGLISNAALLLAAALTDHQKEIAKLMQERPKPGRGG